MLYAMCCTMMYYDMLSLYYVMLYHDVLYYTITIPWYTMICYTMIYHDMPSLYYTMIWCTITLYYHCTMIYYTIPWYTMIYYDMLWYAITILWCATTMSHACHQDRSTSFTHTSYQLWSRNARARIARVSWQKVVFSCSSVWRAWAMPSTLTAWERVRHYVLYDGIVWWYSVM